MAIFSFNLYSSQNNNLFHRYVLNIFIISCHLFNICKNLVIISIDLSYETRLILFDFTLFVGGIHIYSILAFTLSTCFALLLRVLFYLLPNTQNTTFWTKLFDVIDHRIHRNELNLNHKHENMIWKLYNRKIFVTKVVKIFIMVTCK